MEAGLPADPLAQGVFVHGPPGVVGRRLDFSLDGLQGLDDLLDRTLVVFPPTPLGVLGENVNDAPDASLAQGDRVLGSGSPEFRVQDTGELGRLPRLGRHVLERQAAAVDGALQAPVQPLEDAGLRDLQGDPPLYDVAVRVVGLCDFQGPALYVSPFGFDHHGLEVEDFDFFRGRSPDAGAGSGLAVDDVNPRRDHIYLFDFPDRLDDLTG